MLAPEPHLSACLHILYFATLEARAISWRSGDPKQVAALMDAVHNIPVLLQRWEICDEKLLVSTLDDYDRAWGAALRAEYERIVHG